MLVPPDQPKACCETFSRAAAIALVRIRDVIRLSEVLKTNESTPPKFILQTEHELNQKAAIAVVRAIDEGGAPCKIFDIMRVVLCKILYITMLGVSWRSRTTCTSNNNDRSADGCESSKRLLPSKGTTTRTRCEALSRKGISTRKIWSGAY